MQTRFFNPIFERIDVGQTRLSSFIKIKKKKLKNIQLQFCLSPN